MNERQKKIMVPYQEPTDTCPDCSEHPCDCGMPAGYQSDIRFACNFAPHIKVIEASKVAEIIEQRDRLAEALRECREDSVELLGERCFWQNEPRCDYDKRYQVTRDNVTRSDEALQSLNQNAGGMARELAAQDSDNSNDLNG